MGKASRDKRRRHELLQQQRAASRAEYETRVDDPELTALRMKGATDPRAAKLREADYPAQQERLARARWRWNKRQSDGLGVWDAAGNRLRLIHSVAAEEDGEVWAHVSVSTPANTLPTWYDVREVGWLLYPERFGIIVLAPKTSHVNIANVAHAWYCLTSQSCPDFSQGQGTI